MAIIDSVKLPDNSTYDVADNYSGHQTETLATPLTINGVQETTVEGALDGLNDYGDALADNLAANEESGAKNKLPYPYYQTTKTENGITFTDVGDGTITVNGVASGGVTFYLTNNYTGTPLKQGVYKVNGCPINGGATSYRLVIEVYDALGQTVSTHYDDGAGVEVPVAENQSLHLSINVYSGVDLSTPIIFKPMIYDARILDPTFAPYAETNLQLTRKTSGLSNENLIDNSWFTVNQRGYVSGATNANRYIFDMWQVANYTDANGTYALGSSGVTLDNSASAGDSYLVQKFEDALDATRPYTVSIKLGDGTIYKKTGLLPISFEPITGLTVTAYTDRYTIQVNGGVSSVTIRAVKLELGTVSTLAKDVEPNYTTELLKCQRYFKVALNDTWNVGIGIAMATDTIEFYYFSDVPMRVAPSVSTVGSITAVKIADGSEVAISSVEASFDIDAKNGRINFKTSTTLTIRDLYILRTNNAKVMLSADL